MVVLAIGAHPDDVEICCFGTLARCVGRGDRVVVCSVTNGNLGHTTIDSQSLRMIRMAEAARASEKIGAAYCTLDVNDMRLDSSDNEIRLRLTDLIRSVRPDLVITHDPMDYHPDHIATSELVFYCSLQAALPQVSTAASVLDKPCQILYMDKVGGGTFHANEFVDITQTFANKLEALACHSSQVDWLRDHDGIDILHAVEILGEYRGMQSSCRYAEAFRACDQRPLLTRRLLP